MSITLLGNKKYVHTSKHMQAHNPPIPTLPIELRGATRRRLLRHPLTYLPTFTLRPPQKQTPLSESLIFQLSCQAAW